MKIENWDIDKVKPYDKNPRNNDDAAEATANSIKEFGWQQPIVVDTDGVIIAGHTRLKAAKKLKLKQAPVTVFCIGQEGMVAWLRSISVVS